MLPKPNPSATILYASPNEMESHLIRLVMAEKNIEREVINLKIDQMPEEILELNPCEILPTLFDRGMVLYDLHVLTEYLDERFPFPPLLPVDPIEKAEKRLIFFRFTRAAGSWYEIANTIENGDKKEADEARKLLSSGLIELIPLFNYQPYFKSEEFGLVDACLAPLLWRLGALGIDLGAKAKPISDYAKKLFSREAFQESLSEVEKELN
jgi:RNA polymerase-associated protein